MLFRSPMTKTTNRNKTATEKKDTSISKHTHSLPFWQKKHLIFLTLPKDSRAFPTVSDPGQFLQGHPRNVSPGLQLCGLRTSPSALTGSSRISAAAAGILALENRDTDSAAPHSDTPTHTDVPPRGILGVRGAPKIPDEPPRCRTPNLGTPL